MAIPSERRHPLTSWTYESGVASRAGLEIQTRDRWWYLEPLLKRRSLERGFGTRRKEAQDRAQMHSPAWRAGREKEPVKKMGTGWPVRMDES